MTTDAWLEAMARDGFAVRDNLLPDAVFRDLDARALASWRDGADWRTRVKGPGAPKKLPRQSAARLGAIGALLDDVEVRDASAFTYVYHQLHGSEDRTGLVQAAERAAIDAWGELAGLAVGAFARTNFSLTAFTAGCRLTPHTDYGGEHAYRLTILLYFTGKDSAGAPLVFEGRGDPVRIEARPNRSIVFMPSEITKHWIERVPAGNAETVRLALSGWIL